MDWSMIGAIGEILGAVGVIVTLVYLARQISENTVALRREAKLRRQDYFSAPFLAPGSKLPSIAAKIAEVDGTFSYNQPLVDRYGLNFEEAELWMRHISQVWVGLEADYTLEGPSSGVSVLVETFLARPEHQIFWEHVGFMITDPGFLAYVDDVRGRLAEPAE